MCPEDLGYQKNTVTKNQPGTVASSGLAWANENKRFRFALAYTKSKKKKTLLGTTEEQEI